MNVNLTENASLKDIFKNNPPQKLLQALKKLGGKLLINLINCRDDFDNNNDSIQSSMETFLETIDQNKWTEMEPIIDKLIEGMANLKNNEKWLSIFCDIL